MPGIDKEAARPQPLSEAVRARMVRQRRTDTEPEMEIRRRLWRRGLRYRVDYRPQGIRGRVDVAFTKSRVAVFVDGCFWHSCPEHATKPRNNAEWWQAKLSANAARDLRMTEALQQRGWSVVRIWEHEDPEAAVVRVVTALATVGSSAD